MAAIPKKASGKPRWGKDSNFKGKKGKSGPPKGSTNAMRHGLKVSNLPKDCRYIYHRLNNLRRILEAAVLASKREVSLYSGAAINSAIRWERAAQLWERAYRKWPDKYPDAPDKAANASDRRDKCINSLRLDRDVKENVMDALYTLPAPNGKDSDGSSA